MELAVLVSGKLVTVCITGLTTHSLVDLLAAIRKQSMLFCFMEIGRVVIVSHLCPRGLLSGASQLLSKIASDFFTVASFKSQLH